LGVSTYSYNEKQYSFTDGYYASTGKIATLTPGSGFGELSILSAVHKFRTASAICNTNDSLLFILYENTYNAVLRRHHFRQQEMSQAIEFMKGIPLCNTYNYSQLAGLAYSMKTCGFEKKAVIIEAGNKISCVYIVRSGDVWVSTEVEKSCSNKKPCRMPALALCILAIGKVLGEQDILDGKITYSSSYIANSDCWLYEIPLETYRNALKTPSFEYPATAQITKDLKQKCNGRAERAKTSIESLLLNLTEDFVLKGDLMKVLPSVIEADSPHQILPTRTPIAETTRPETGHMTIGFEDSFEYFNLQRLSHPSPWAPTTSMRRSTTSPRSAGGRDGGIKA
jgi:CRP-like cAMP-binding protein